MTSEEQRRGRILAHLINGDLEVEQAAAWIADACPLPHRRCGSTTLACVPAIQRPQAPECKGQSSPSSSSASRSGRLRRVRSKACSWRQASTAPWLPLVRISGNDEFLSYVAELNGKNQPDWYIEKIREEIKAFVNELEFNYYYQALSVLISLASNRWIHGQRISWAPWNPRSLNLTQCSLACEKSL